MFPCNLYPGVGGNANIQASSYIMWESTIERRGGLPRPEGAATSACHFANHECVHSEYTARPLPYYGSATSQEDLDKQM